MGDGRVALTREGYNKKLEELEYLKGPKRREIARALSEARAQGDLSENAEYDAAKEEQAMNEKRIADLEDVLSRANIIDSSTLSGDEARLGMTVKLKDLESGEEFSYMLVSEEESDFDADKISVSSPVGRAIVGHKVGDRIEIEVPAGTLSYEVRDISPE
ncbi:MAG: transcription elongation factor GreA [Candidatus Omnitrophica bacterium]|nr:transcription elongation factor GreA [Candidatus Omnitrophota bacterium]